MDIIEDTAIIVCTRLKSSRIHKKCAVNVNGKILLEHLNSRLQKTGIPIIYAVPQSESIEYQSDVFPQLTGHYDIIIGHDNDPMKRMYAAAVANKVKHIIRVTHDKVFVDPDDIYKALAKYKEEKLDYLYSNRFTDGTGFEIISIKALKDATDRFNNIEHISYAVKAVALNVHNLDMNYKFHPTKRLLVDFPEDVDLLNLLFACLGNECTQQQVFDFLDVNEWATNINKKPYCTIYTCAYNAEKYLHECLNSVATQHYFEDYEYLLIDDHSSDKTPYIMAKFASKFSNVRFMRNFKNLGLASSSNVALSHGRGRYIVRLDADDYFLENNSVIELIESIETPCRKKYYDAIYPNYFHGNRSTIRRARKEHHVGGALFNTRAINHIKFTDGLRGHDSLDVWARAKDVLHIGYVSTPIFMYRQHDASLSKNNLVQRAKIKQQLIDKHGLMK